MHLVRRVLVSQESIGVVNRVLQKHFKNSAKYNEAQKEYVKELQLTDVKTRVLSFLLDSIFMFWPSMIFIVAFLLLTSPANIGESLVIDTWDLTIVYCLSILSFNTLSGAYWMGQTFGMRYYDLKVVQKDHSEVTAWKMICRELFGVSLPWVLILISFNFVGFTTFFISFALFIIGNLAFIILYKTHVSPIDLLLGTTMIVLPNDDEYEYEDAETTESNDIIVEAKQEEPMKKDIEEEIVIESEETNIQEVVLDKTIEVSKEIDKSSPLHEDIKEELIQEDEQVDDEVVKDSFLKEEPIEEPSIEELSIDVTSEKSIEKEKSVTEIISEAVSVVDQALENKKEIYPVKIEKPKKTKIIDEPVKEEMKEKLTAEATKAKKTDAKKNQKKKNGKNTKASTKKTTVKAKSIKPASVAKKPSKKSA